MIITSKDPIPFENAKNLFAIYQDEKRVSEHHVTEKKDIYEWNFKTESDEIFAANRMMNIGFEFVRRV